MPRGCQRAGFGLAVADHADNEQIRVVERRPCSSSSSSSAGVPALRASIGEIVAVSTAVVSSEVGRAIIQHSIADSGAMALDSRQVRRSSPESDGTLLSFP